MKAIKVKKIVLMEFNIIRLLTLVYLNQSIDYDTWVY